MAEAQALRLEQQSVKFAKQQQPSCRLMGQAVSTVRLTAANLALTNCGRTHERDRPQHLADHFGFMVARPAVRLGHLARQQKAESGDG